jgi:tetratricopeptide (TPR) repeat protein
MRVKYRIYCPAAKVLSLPRVDCFVHWRNANVQAVAGGGRVKITVSILLLFALCPAAYTQHQHATAEKLGAVSFPISCAAQVQSSFNRAVALLHSFAYAPAAAAFQEVAGRDPGCAMAHWGIAMSYYNQLWSPPLPGEAAAKGRSELERAQEIGGGSAKEKEYIAAASFIFTEDGGAYPAHAAKYRDAMASIAQHYPDDAESQILYALALLATASPQDKTHANQKTAAGILEPLYQKHPQHPGLSHYLIHAYDNAELAPQGLKAAREYSQIAPSAPHALHMPSHIFTRLGMWSNSVRSNQAARVAAHEQGDMGEELHAMDYLVYALLQEGREADAASVLKDLQNLRQQPGSDFKSAYAATAMPVRYAVERKQWNDATRCTAPQGAPPHIAALAAWARALGHARAGDAEAGRVEQQSIQRMAEQLRNSGNLYWSGLVQIQAEEAGAWIAVAEHKPDEALALMKKAADEEDAVEKLPVTPGPVVPAREQLGDLLSQLGQPEAALAAYEKALQDAPGRRGALQGALASARAAGLKSKSSYYDAELKKLN